MAAKTPALTPTIHITKPTDKIPGVDVYTDKRDTPINGIAKKISALTNSFLKDWGGVVPKGTLLQAVKGVTMMVQQGVTIAKVADDIAGAFKFSKADLKGIGAGASAEILKNMGYPADVNILINGALGIPGAQPIETFFTNRSPALRAVLADGSIKKLIDGDFDTAQDLAKLLGGVAGSKVLTKVFDGNAQFAIFSAIVSSARALNMPEIYDTIKDTIKDDDDRKRFLLDGATQAATAGDVAYLALVIDQTSIGRLQTVVPEVIPQLLSGYSRKSADSVLDGFAETLAFINGIDPNWHRVMVNGKSLMNLGALTNASNDALDALVLHPQYRTMAALAQTGKYREQSSLVLFKARYPKSTLAASY